MLYSFVQENPADHAANEDILKVSWQRLIIPRRVKWAGTRWRPTCRGSRFSVSTKIPLGKWSGKSQFTGEMKRRARDCVSDVEIPISTALELMDPLFLLLDRDGQVPQFERRNAIVIRILSMSGVRNSFNVASSALVRGENSIQSGPSCNLIPRNSSVGIREF